MYILNRHINSRQRRHGVVFAGLVLVAIGVGGYFAKQLLTSDTTIGPAPAAVIRHVTDGRPAAMTVEESLYSFKLPGDWERFTPTESIANSMTWHNIGAKNKGTQVLTVYIDAAVQNLAVNRAIAVQPNGAGITITGEASDNCVNFTTPGQSASSGKVAAKWHGVDFLCDSGNYIRNVIGIGAPGAINGIRLTGPTSGVHSVFMTFTDNGPTPSNDVLVSTLQTFQLK